MNLEIYSTDVNTLKCIPYDYGPCVWPPDFELSNLQHWR